MAKYKWDSPAEWLLSKMETEIHAANSDGTHSALQSCMDSLHGYAQALLGECDSDTVQDLFQSEMDQDGYFFDQGKLADLSRERCVELLEGIGIECRDEESTEELREAVESNIEDGTLAYSEVA